MKSRHTHLMSPLARLLLSISACLFFLPQALAKDPTEKELTPYHDALLQHIDKANASRWDDADFRAQYSLDALAQSDLEVAKSRYLADDKSVIKLRAYADALYLAGKSGEAEVLLLGALEEYRKYSPSSLNYYVAIMLADFYDSQDDFEKAVKYYKKSIDIAFGRDRRTRVVALLIYAYALKEHGHFDQAIKLVASAKSLNKLSIDQRLFAAHILTVAGYHTDHADDAKKQLEFVLSRQEARPRVAIETLVDLGAYDAAAKIVHQAIKNPEQKKGIALMVQNGHRAINKYQRLFDVSAALQGNIRVLPSAPRGMELSSIVDPSRRGALASGGHTMMRAGGQAYSSVEVGNSNLRGSPAP